MIFPALSGPFFLFPLAGNATANLVRNVWSFTIIFCGHFPEGTHEFTEEETENESRGQWYYRQLLGSANLSGSRPFHILSGNLSFQIEHHLFPDLPANRYAEISTEVREICERYGIPYNVGPLGKQFGSVVKKICRLALPDRRSGGLPGPHLYGGRRRARRAPRSRPESGASQPTSRAGHRRLRAEPRRDWARR